MGSRSSARDNAIDPIKMEDEEAFLYAMQLGSASVFPMVLKCALELDLLETIAKSGPGSYVSSSELVSRLPKLQNADACLMLDRILRLLASYSVLECVVMNLPGGGVEQRYGPRPVCKYLIKDKDGVSIAPLLLMNQDKVLVESWYHLKDAIVEGGIPFNKAHGVHAFQYHGTDQRFNKVFNLAMSNHSIMNMKQILEVYDGFDGVATLVDVGGGIGSSLKMIVSKYPSIKGINFDLPHVIKDTKPYHGIEYVGGDMFVSVPKADAIFMKWICHDWSDEHCLKLLKNCYKSLPDNGKVIVAECLLPEEPDYSLAAKIVVHVDVMMLTFNPGGKERTRKEFEVLAKGAGFKGFHKACFAYNTWIMEFLK